MKKHVLLLWLVFSALSTELSGQTVYITKTGEKKHISSCHYLSKSQIAIDLIDVLSHGYEAYKVCRPTQDITSTKTSSDEKPNLETTNTTKTQCSGTPQKSARCKRMTTSTDWKCWQHGGIEYLNAKNL